MEGKSVDVYKSPMAQIGSIARDYFLRRTPPTLHILLFAYSRLERWEHVALCSPYWRWYWNDRAGAYVTYQQDRIELTPRAVVLIPPNVQFATHTPRPVGHLYCHFWLGVRGTVGEAGPIRVALSKSSQASLRALTTRLRRAGDSIDEMEVSLSVLSHVASSLAEAGYAWHNREPDPLIDRVRHRLHDLPPHESIENPVLADEIGLSVNTLLRRFRLATGTSPRQYLINLRVERAAQMLRETDAPIADIAERCGFVDRYHLSRVFARFTGTSPAAYRSRSRKPQHA